MQCTTTISPNIPSVNMYPITWTEKRNGLSLPAPQTTTYIGNVNGPKALCFRHGLDGLSVEERRAKLSKYQPTAEWATKVVDALEILQVTVTPDE